MFEGGRCAYMSFFRFLRNLISPTPSDKLTFDLDPEVTPLLDHLASRRLRTKGQVVNDLIKDANDRDIQTGHSVQIWESLTPRQKDVTAYICLGLNNKHIAARLFVATETVKTHVHNVFINFNVHSKGELRSLLEGWDFRSWDNRIS